MKRYAVCASLAVVLSAGPSFAASTGDTPEALRATQALNILESQGFAADLQDRSASAFADFRQRGKDFIATVSQKGRSFVVIVNPDTGEVTRQE
jgi:hypothetical protein